jgi:HlyD family secretion protein
MADLNLVQVRTLVDETDIGKIRAGLRATVTVGSYPNQPFEGTVLKIEPLAETVQNVTMFAVQVRIENRNGLLKPGMNADVEMHIGQRDSVLAVPNGALRTPRDVNSAAQVLGIDDERLKTLLADAEKRRDSSRTNTMAAQSPQSDTVKVDTLKGAGEPGSQGARGGATMTTPDGRQVPLPEGITESEARSLMQKRFGGGTLTSAENEKLQKVMAAFRAGGGGRGFGGGGGQGRRFGGGMGGGADYQFGGNYIVFVRRDGEPTPVYIRTGLTDLDYSEVVSGLTASDSVLVLPSASLVQQQTDQRNRMTQMTGGGAVPGMTTQPPRTGTTGTPATPPAGGARPPGGR